MNASVNECLFESKLQNILLYKEEIFFFQDDPRQKIEVSCIDTCLGLNTPCFIKTNTLVTWAYFGTHTFQIVFGLPKPFTSSLFFIQFRESCNKSFFSNGFKDNQDLLLLRTHDLQQKWNFRLFSDRIRRGLQKKKIGQLLALTFFNNGSHLHPWFVVLIKFTFISDNVVSGELFQTNRDDDSLDHEFM